MQNRNRVITRDIRVKRFVYVNQNTDIGNDDALHGADDHTLKEGLQGLFSEDEIVKIINDRNGSNNREYNKRDSNREGFKRRDYKIGR